MRGADVDDIVRGGHIGETPVVELWERCFHVDGNGLREACEGVKVGHDAKRSQSLFHSSATGYVGATMKKNQQINEAKEPHDHFFGNTRNRKNQKLKPSCCSC